MATESKSQGDYVSLSALFRLVQAGRRELGLQPYKNRCSLSFALVANRIPTRKVNSRRRIDGLYKHIRTDKEPPLGIESEGESWMAGDIPLRLVSRNPKITTTEDGKVTYEFWVEEP